MPRDSFAVDPGSVAAVQVLQKVRTVLAYDARVAARSPVIAQHEMIIGLAPHHKGQRLQRYARALTGRMQHEERSWRKVVRFQCLGWYRGHHCPPDRTASFRGGAASSFACATSLARNAWQCEQ